jgi:hypothetical protein
MIFILDQVTHISYQHGLPREKYLNATSVLEQNEFVQCLWCFDNSRVLKEQIEFANVCSSVQNLRLKICINIHKI